MGRKRAHCVGRGNRGSKVVQARPDLGRRDRYGRFHGPPVSHQDPRRHA